MDPDPSPSIEVAVEDADWHSIVTDPEKCCIDAVRACLPFIAERLGNGWPPRSWTVSVLLADDDTVQTLNRQHRFIDRPTNVLSFPLAEPGDIEVGSLPLMLGDIVLARQTVRREALAQDIAVDAHIAHLTVHGFLHLIGFDHQDDTEARQMEDLEGRILASMGIADPYESELVP